MKKLQKAHVIGMEFQPRLKWDLGHMSGFVRVMENLESHGISKKKFQAWKVMEFRSESWKVMENCYNLTFCKNRDENKENSLLSQVFV